VTAVRCFVQQWQRWIFIHPATIEDYISFAKQDTQAPDLARPLRRVLDLIAHPEEIAQIEKGNSQ
jgi:hypothetical protein